MTAPLVAVLVGRNPADRYSLHRGYVDALWQVGAAPVVLACGEAGDAEKVVDTVLRCDALLVTGGGDVNPSRYGGAPDPTLMDLDDVRDAYELAAVREMHGRGGKVFGICRGIQVIAVALGGSLHVDVAAAGFTVDHWREEEQNEPVHRITTVDGSLARKLLGSELQVNSIHHQAVADPGPLLTAGAHADDGLIESVEADGVLGIQWHPERLRPRDDAALAPFEWLRSA